MQSGTTSLKHNKDKAPMQQQHCQRKKETNSNNHFDFNHNLKPQSTFLNVNCSVVGALPETTTKVTLVIGHHNHQLIQANCALCPLRSEKKILCCDCFVVCFCVLIFSSVLSLSPCCWRPSSLKRQTRWSFSALPLARKNHSCT